MEVHNPVYQRRRWMYWWWYEGEELRLMKLAWRPIRFLRLERLERLRKQEWQLMCLQHLGTGCQSSRNLQPNFPQSSDTFFFRLLDQVLNSHCHHYPPHPPHNHRNFQYRMQLHARLAQVPCWELLWSGLLALQPLSKERNPCTTMSSGQSLLPHII